MLDNVQPRGKHPIAGAWIGAETTFSSAPLTGDPHHFAAGSKNLIDRAVRAAEEAFARFGQSSRQSRAAWPDAIAEEIEARGAAITAIGTAETGLPAARLDGERGRTTGQLRLFAEVLRDGSYLDTRHAMALPDRRPLPHAPHCKTRHPRPC